MLSRATIKKLSEKLPELQELRDHLADEARKLDSLEGLEDLTITERAYEVTARLRAYETIKRILEPIVNVDNDLSLPDPKEFVL